MIINSKLIKFRKKIRSNQKHVIDLIVKDHLAEICVFCGMTDSLTREHVIPQWVYSRCVKRTFITTTNSISQTYNKTTVPACKDCNSNLLGFLERELKHEFDSVNVHENSFSQETIELIILWLETLEYKFHVLDLRRKLNRVKDSDFIPYIAQMPISMFQGPIDASPAKVFSNLRNALKVLSVKSKVSRVNSLCILSTKNTDFHFFHSTNNYIFIELAEFGVAFFYFYKQTFSDHNDALLAAQDIVKKEYSENCS
ncbi:MULTISPECIES: hypothetical protein [unclassified Shewanella]|uniref:hypothetical protein n=1 Tax=unclassified Shewanella TaxID=196818 RepID=UPI00332FDC17|tara:strand:+ start:889 stop:1653 length:765 start_codon:yes stop_codon:yes gene_type:complete